MRVITITYDERLLELSSIELANEWRKKAPRYFFSKDIWAIGSTH